jgi:F0F1-type ATP synthase membrane subunit c/vacuolar-type H+-ATPase subunit K
MMEIPERGANEKGLRTLWIIWAAMVGSLLVYVFLCHQFGEDIRRTASHDLPLGLIRSILSVVAFVTLFLTHFIRKGMLGGRFASSGAGLFKPGGASNQPSLLVVYTTAVIVSLALCDSVGLFGLVLFMLGDSFRTLHIFIGVSALAMYFFRPKREEFETLALALQTNEAPPPL